MKRESRMNVIIVRMTDPPTSSLFSMSLSWIGQCSIPWWKWWASCKTYSGSDCAAQGYDFEDLPRHYDGKKVYCYKRASQISTGGKRFSTEQRKLLASAVFDSFVFAGGLSVPSVISTAMGVLFGKDFASVRAAAGIDSDNLNTRKSPTFARLQRG